MKYFTLCRDSETRVWVFFLQCQYSRVLLKEKNMGQNLFKKYSNSQGFSENFYFGITRLRKTILNYCDLLQNVKTESF